MEGFGIGTYMLTVSLSDVIDDHANSEGDATAIRVGADVRGALDYDGDVDFFRFQAEQGRSYQIDVALGTLDDSIVTARLRRVVSGQQRRLRGYLGLAPLLGSALVLASVTLQWRATHRDLHADGVPFRRH